MRSPSKSTIRISVLETDPVRFLGISSIFASERDMHLRAVTTATLLDDGDADIVLVPNCKGAAFHATMSALRMARPQIRVIVTGAGRDEEDILRAMTYGAKGYVAEEATPDELKRAIHELHKGAVWFPGQVLATFIERATSNRKMLHEADGKISERELEVLRLLVAGNSNPEIAGELGIEERTVKAHVAQLLRKVGVQNRIALSVHAVTHALLAARS